MLGGLGAELCTPQSIAYQIMPIERQLLAHLFTARRYSDFSEVSRELFRFVGRCGGVVLALIALQAMLATACQTL